MPLALGLFSLAPNKGKDKLQKLPNTTQDSNSDSEPDKNTLKKMKSPDDPCEGSSLTRWKLADPPKTPSPGNNRLTADTVQRQGNSPTEATPLLGKQPPTGEQLQKNLRRWLYASAAGLPFISLIVVKIDSIPVKFTLIPGLAATLMSWTAAIMAGDTAFELSRLRRHEKQAAHNATPEILV
jgi:hypothetical protein